VYVDKTRVTKHPADAQYIIYTTILQQQQIDRQATTPASAQLQQRQRMALPNKKSLAPDQQAAQGRRGWIAGCMVSQRCCCGLLDVRATTQSWGANACSPEHYGRRANSRRRHVFPLFSPISFIFPALCSSSFSRH
jgi:hypothetical protein